MMPFRVHHFYCPKFFFFYCPDILLVLLQVCSIVTVLDQRKSPTNDLLRSQNFHLWLCFRSTHSSIAKKTSKHYHTFKSPKIKLSLLSTVRITRVHSYEKKKVIHYLWLQSIFYQYRKPMCANMEENKPSYYA